MKSKTKTHKCTCKHEFQDKQYGPNNRVMTPVKSPLRPKFRCTVYGAVHEG